jgi:hypothetical protein
MACHVSSSAVTHGNYSMQYLEGQESLSGANTTTYHPSALNRVVVRATSETDNEQYKLVYKNPDNIQLE